MTPSQKLARAVANALPLRQLKIEREALIAAAVAEIERWLEIAPQGEPHAGRIRQLAKIAAKLEKDLEAAGAALRKLGVHAQIERARSFNAKIGLAGAEQPIGGRSAAIDLYLIAARAADGMRGWRGAHRPRKGRATAFSTRLSESLRVLCRTHAGMSNFEFADFLDCLSGSNGLPVLSAPTLKKRAARARKHTRTRGTK